MFNDAFASPNGGAPDLFPARLAAEQAALSELIYDRVNNGVYRAGFAGTQSAYEQAYHEVFSALDRSALAWLLPDR